MMQSYNYANVCKSMLSKAHDLTPYTLCNLETSIEKIVFLLCFIVKVFLACPF
jgi:hypothetical protein